jgi:hypothetical protein
MEEREGGDDDNSDGAGAEKSDGVDGDSRDGAKSVGDDTEMAS